MEEIEAVRALGALSHSTRMRVFKTLARAGSAGLGSSDIAKAVGVPQNLMSAHLSVLSEAGIVTREARGRSRIYRISAEKVLSLAEHLRGLVPPADLE